MKFPKVKQKLPELFKEIIRYDNLIEAVTSDSVIDLNSWKNLSSKRNELVKAADEKYRAPKKKPKDN